MKVSVLLHVEVHATDGLELGGFTIQHNSYSQNSSHLLSW